ncbi:hypothetical protein HW555_004049 [Spodoptera exigua]|uniref:CCHC-type domain-containing protein n=1 Tax=Spodoptera exigua TaxID=7107 RepID=A0A835L8Q1_SPOEX|nr:hypothetical protein HW555_004049 [Spodoptera exigua]
MGEEQTNIDFCYTSSSEIMEEDIGDENEQQVDKSLTEERSLNKRGNSEQRMPEKRGRQDDDEVVEDDEGFVTIVRGHKRAARRDSKEVLKETTEVEECVVCVTSNKERFPKQFGMAKWLRGSGIENITKMSYKGPYKILIHFENRESALQLISSTKLHEFEYRAYIINELQLAYGILRQVDLEMEEKEILDNLRCEFEIQSVKRLKRLDNSGKWIDSETIRICFKSSTLPPYVYGYGCRFQVEPFTFPVSQCSSCWKYGHLSRSCPNKYLTCPKCAGKHANCETTIYVCVNCKGPHMALNKICPIFIKEKAIRDIMTKNRCTYRTALETYNKKVEYLKNPMHQNDLHKVDKQVNHNNIMQTSSQINITQEASNDNLNRFFITTDAIIHNEIPTSESCAEVDETGQDSHPCYNNSKKRNKLRKHNLDEQRPKPYWNPSLSKLVAERRLALSQFRKNPTPRNLTILENKTQKAKTAIRQAKLHSWQDYCSSINEQTSSSEMWKRMRWAKGFRSPREENRVKIA